MAYGRENLTASTFILPVLSINTVGRGLEHSVSALRSRSHTVREFGVGTPGEYGWRAMTCDASECKNPNGRLIKYIRKNEYGVWKEGFRSPPHSEIGGKFYHVKCPKR